MKTQITHTRFSAVSSTEDKAATIHVVLSGSLLRKIEDEAKRRQASKSSVAREVLVTHFSEQPAASAA